MLIVAWRQGSSTGRRLLREAEQREARAADEAARATASATQAQQSAAEAMAEKERALLMARRANFASLTRMTEQDPYAIRSAMKLPLDMKVSACLRIGQFPDETPEDHARRRQAIVEERTREWRFRGSYGYRLLPFVEAQGGLCGDPSKDHMGKGCGCSLFALHPSTVDIDHIRPRSQGGDDSTQNLQALCTMCNRTAGAKYWEPGEAPPPSS